VGDPFLKTYKTARILHRCLPHRTLPKNCSKRQIHLLLALVLNSPEITFKRTVSLEYFNTQALALDEAFLLFTRDILGENSTVTNIRIVLKLPVSANELTQSSVDDAMKGYSG